MVYPRFLRFSAHHHSSPHSTTNKENLLKMRLFFLWFTLLFIFIGAMHFTALSLMDISPNTVFFWECYLGNYFLTLLLLFALLRAFERLSHSIAWICLLTSGLKFAFFFLLLLPLFKADGSVTNVERFSFFVPYFSGLILETGALINKLNKL